MENSYYKGLEPLWGDWYIDKLIGEGSFGKVFRIVRNTSSGMEEAALKAITIPQSNSEYSEMLSYESDENTVNAYYKDAVMNLNKETLLMAALRGNKNIVEYQDHVINEHKNEVGWDILIRMELLTSLTTLLRERNLKRDEVVRLGIDICNALTACQKYGIIHRDIKPANIFIDKNGNYKLGDFGVSRAMEKTQGFMSKKGTYSFMAPEVYKGESYGVQADIYSLGMVMYFLMNARKIPFQPLDSKGISFSVKEECLNRRMSGENIPAPAFADEALARIILKACEFNPENRYDSAKEMADALSKLILVNQKQDEQTWESSHIERQNETQPVEVENQEGSGVSEKINEEIADDDLDSDRTVAMFDAIPTSQDTGALPQYQAPEPGENVAVSKDDKNIEGDNSQIVSVDEKEKKKRRYGILIIIIMIIIAGQFVNNKMVKAKSDKDFNTAVEYYDKQDYVKAKEWFEKAAEDGNARAMACLGVLYCYGYGVEQDYAKAKEWYEKSAEGGDAEAMTCLGVLYEYGHGVEQDYAKAKEWYEKAVEGGNTNAINNLGILYYNGYGVEQDYAKAKEWFEKGAEGGDAGAMFGLGVLYEYGHGVEQDYAKAKEWFEKAAEGGNTNAMNNLGLMYVNGEGVEQDYVKAKEWYEKSAEGGDAEAMTCLGVLYYYGDGVARDYAKAKEWYEKAADAGDAYAMQNLGDMYYYGYGVKIDYKKAKEWYEKAKAAGYEN